MTNSVKLNDIIRDSGLKTSYIANSIGVSRQSLWKKVANQSEFKAREINKLCSILGIHDLNIKESIFFAVQGDE